MRKRLYAITCAACAGAWMCQAEPVDLAGEDLRVTVAADLAADGYVNSAEQTATLTLDFADDATLPPVAGAIRLVKLGAGTVAFADARTYTGGTVVSNGLLSTSDQNWLGAPSAPITLAGGGLALLRAEKNRITLNRSVVVAPGATGTLAAQAEGGELSFANTSVVFKAATLRLAAYGTGTAWFNIARNANGSSYNSTGNGNGGTVVVEPYAWLNLYEGDAFGGANHQTDITLHIREGGVVSSGGNHSPLTRNVILEGGGRITATYLRLNGLADGRRVENMLDATTWQSLDLTRRLTVVPGSLTGAAEAVLDAPNVHLAPNDQDAVFDIQADATLVVDSQLWPAHAQSNRSLRKTGTGTMELRRPLNIGGRFRVEEGTLRLADNTTLGVIAGLDVSPNARIELGHGALVDTAPALTFPGSFLATADVWFDAAQLCGYADGDTVSTVTNRGTVGGMFGAFPFGNDFGRPTYAANALNGGPAIYCRGGTNGSGLYLDYTNKTDKLTVFFVMRWDGWTSESDADGNKGKYYFWHGPLAMGPATLGDETKSCEDFNVGNRFYLQWSGSLGAFGCYGVGVNGSPAATFDGAIAVDVPMVIGIVRDGTTMRARTWWTDAYPDFKETNIGHGTTPWEIECIGLGTRLAYTNGKVKPNANRALRGWIGELIVFSRTLSENETAFVQRYLQRKWGESEQAAVTMPEVTGGDATVHVSVADGAEAVVNLILPSTEKRSEKVLSDQRIAKVGAGRLGVRAGVDAVDRIDVREGTALFNAETSAAAIWVDASDADTVTLADDHVTVTAVRNKGHLGGMFKPNPYVVPGKSVCPAPKYGALGERGALAFDGNSALALEASPTEMTSREFFVCAAFVRDSYVDEGGKGKWAGPIAFYSKSETGLDIHGSTGFHTEETIDTNGLAKVNAISKGGVSPAFKYTIADKTPYVFAFWETSGVGSTMGGGAGTDVADADGGIVSVAASIGGGFAPPMTYDIVQLGGRLQGGGAPQWNAVDDEWNRMWHGRIGEMIAFDRQPSRDQVAATLDYLRKKWLGAGDGSATPPAFLTGGEVVDDTSTTEERVSWHVSAGATLATAGKPAAIGPVVLADGAALARENVVDAVDAFRLFDTPSLAFGGTVTVSAPAFPVGDVTLLTADAVTGTPVWRLVDGRKVSRRGSDYVITAPGLVIFIR